MKNSIFNGFNSDFVYKAETNSVLENLHLIRKKNYFKYSKNNYSVFVLGTLPKLGYFAPLGLRIAYMLLLKNALNNELYRSCFKSLAQRDLEPRIKESLSTF